MSKKVAPGAGPAFAQADLAGTWHLYLQRVEAKLTSGTWQVGQVQFTSAGVFTTATLHDVANAETTLTPPGGLSFSAPGGVVTGDLKVAGTAADLYRIRGTMRAAKDLITGVVTAKLGATEHHGLLTMVRGVTMFDLGQASYEVAEGQALTVTVIRGGNLAAPATVRYAAGGGNAPAGSYSVSGTGTLSFGAGVSSATFKLMTVGDTATQGGRTVNLTLSSPSGAGAILGTLTGAVVNIRDDDVPGTVVVSTPALTTAETGSAMVGLKRFGGVAGGVVVGFRTVDGTAHAGVDYTATNGSVTFTAGQLTLAIPVPIRPNQMVDGDRTFTLELDLDLAAGGHYRFAVDHRDHHSRRRRRRHRQDRHCGRLRPRGLAGGAHHHALGRQWRWGQREVVDG